MTQLDMLIPPAAPESRRLPVLSRALQPAAALRP